MGRKKQGQKTGPQLDAQFITRTGSPQVLQRQVCSEESMTQMHSESFWFASSEVTSSRSVIPKEKLAEKEIPVKRKVRKNDHGYSNQALERQCERSAKRVHLSAAAPSTSTPTPVTLESIIDLLETMKSIFDCRVREMEDKLTRITDQLIKKKTRITDLLDNITS